MLPKSTLRDLASIVSAEATLTNVAMAELLTAGFPEHGVAATLDRVTHRLDEFDAASANLRAEAERLKAKAAERDEEARRAMDDRIGAEADSRAIVPPVPDPGGTSGL